MSRASRTRLRRLARVLSLHGAVASALGCLVTAAAVSAQTVPFVEDFALDESGWTDNTGFLLSFEPSGGPDGSSFAYSEFDFTEFIEPFPGAGPIVIRAHDENMASNAQLEGNWDAAGVTELHVWVRHNAPVDVAWILRIANTFNFPAAAFDAVDPVVPPDTWTELIFEVDAASPYCIPESSNPAFTCLNALTNVAHVQLGTDAPAVLISDGTLVTFDVDKVALVPEPDASWMLLAGIGGLALLARRRLHRWS